MNSLSMEILAIIPARGGSKGIPRKNIIKLAGIPLIAHTIEAALRSKYITRLIVSTEDQEIANVSQKFGAEVVWRPEEISGDEASIESALLYSLEFLQADEGYYPDLLVFLQCTSPLTTALDIDNTIQVLLENHADTSLTVSPFHYFIWKTDKDGNVSGINHDKQVRLRRQDKHPQYIETGSVYVMRVKQFLSIKHRFFGKTVMNIIPNERCLEIDEPVDFIIAKTLLEQYRVKK